ncbi:MAG: DNA-directed RNA polymerase subunit beta' [Lentisphaerae bacterium]|nr:DNA-directed RNA polymerase subunit beta' [Lentisphaerota bacterium]MCP4101235.1 DNA-directed RNA polymerase subunit beta' [Lentisphaerota bacterium]
MIDNTYAYRELLGKSSSTSFGAVSINVASPDVIRSWSFGEVKNPETINYRSFKPEKGGLFCEKIFGPTRDWECNCGKYKRVKHKGIICDRCGVEVTQSKVRRDRMGHIELAVPVSHIWFFKCMPSRIGLMIDMTAKSLERVVYYEDWVITDPGDTPLEVGQTMSELEYRQAREDYGDAFAADMGAPAIKTLLEQIDLPILRDELELALEGTKNKAIRKKLAKRLRLVEGFIGSNSRPEWMILTVLPVIPPDLRPLVPLEGGRFATSDLNDLYRRVINRNNRLKNLLQLRTPEVIIRNEKRMLQEAVDALMDNGRHGRAVTGAGNRPLKSLSDMLKGKQGRFRQNLLGKRVDYSGRSVIVVGPELKLWQCGLPKKMALILFEPFIIRHLKGRGYAHTVRGAKKMIERGETVVWDILEEVTKGHPVMLNRAPTLHRLSIQAFDPVLIEGSAIRIHPLVCTAYNADFDGDQMAVHVPLSNEAQMETKLLMLAPNNIFSPAHGNPITTPTQDITLGSYFLTFPPKNKDKAKCYKDYFEVLYALDCDFIHIHDAVKIPNPNFGTDTIYGDKGNKFLLTTPGRCIFNEIWDDQLGFFNEVAKKKQLGLLVSDSYKIAGHQRTVTLLDDLKDLGYKWATLAGFSISITDLNVPEMKESHIDTARGQIDKVMNQYNTGVLTEGERHNKVIDIWTQTSNSVANELFNTLEAASRRGEINPVYAMLDSGARGSRDQIRQLAGMRGLMAKPSGDIIERPIISNFREGLTVLEYFISTHGARKGLADTALKTADSGYMTRKLVDVAQDIICREDDCGTVKGVWASAIVEGDEVILPLRDRIMGRFGAMDIKDPAFDDGRLIIGANEEFTIDSAALIEKRGIQKVLIRSNLTCETPHGVCIKCYGRNLASDRLAKSGDALGIIAAQSIGEPGTQLTMRTFHIGGTASSAYKQPVIAARNAGTIKLVNVRTVTNQKGETVVVNKNGYIVIYDQKTAKEAESRARSKAEAEAAAIGSFYNKDYDYWSDALREAELDRYELEAGAVLSKGDDEKVKANEKFVHWDPYHVPIIAEEDGIVELHDLVEGVTLNRSKRGGTEEITVMEHREDLHPQIVLSDKNGEFLANYPLPAGAFLMAKEGEKIVPGIVLARVPRQTAKNKDITGGLPRIAELFEARIPKDIAEIARIDGIVEVDKMSRGRRQLVIRDPETGITEEHNNIPANKHLTVSKGDFVNKGQKLTEGSLVPHALLEVCGAHELQRYLVDEIQLVYRAQGVEINDKHIEIIIRQMMQKVRISDQGSTMYLPGEQIDRVEFDKENQSVVSKGGKPGEAEPILLGITKASLETESFISAASFQDTTRILTEAATYGKIDSLNGFKENVITGHLIPAGTGTCEMQGLRLQYLGEEISPEMPELIGEDEKQEVAEGNSE